jgi:hypothetical protein
MAERRRGGIGQLLLTVRYVQRSRWAPEAKYRGVGYALKPRGTDSPSLSRRDQKSEAVRATSADVVGIEVLNRGAFGVGTWTWDLETRWGTGGFPF